MAVHTKWFPTLVKRMRSKQDNTEVEWHEGITPKAIFMAEGFSEADAESVLVVVNDTQVDLTEKLRDGDRLEFLVSIQGG
jgi:sulfur carrier protein ThiS